MNQNADEKTILDQNNEQTVLDNQEQQQTVAPKQAEATGTKRNGTWKKVAMGTGTGIVMGAAAAILTSGASATDVELEAEPEDLPENSVMSFDNIGVATSVSDNMSFGEAFAAARAEVGTGGVFEWHGNLYNTFTAEEWDQMTTEDRNDFASHISYESHEEHHTNYTAHNQESHHNDDVAVHTAEEQNTDGHQGGEAQVVEVVEQPEHLPEVEVLGVVHDAETGINYGGMVIDGQEVMVVDVNGDEVFDVALSDLNQDEQITEDEIGDISDMGITVDDLGGFTDPMDNNILAGDEADYTNDPGMYEA